MFTGIRDLDRKIIETVDRKDYLALLLTNKYIFSLFDDIFFRNQLKKEFDFNCTKDPKKYYILNICFNNIDNMLDEGKIGIYCKLKDKKEDVKKLGIWNKESVRNCFCRLFYSKNRDELCLYLNVTYESVIFTSNINYFAKEELIERNKHNNKNLLIEHIFQISNIEKKIFSGYYNYNNSYFHHGYKLIVEKCDSYIPKL